MEKKQTKRNVKKKEEIVPILVSNVKSKDSIINEELVNKIAEQLDVDKRVVYAVIRSQWDLLSKVIRDGKYYSLRIKFFGIFGVKNYRFLYSRRYRNYFVSNAERFRGVNPEHLKVMRDKEEHELNFDKDIDLYATEY